MVGGTNESEKCRLLEAETGHDGCRPYYDQLLCWPHASLGSVAHQPCFSELQGIRYDTGQNASRLCFSNGTWSSADYTRCTEVKLITPETESGVVMMTFLYFIGYSISLLFLIIGVSIYLSYRELKCLRNTIHKNLMITYILADALWIIMSAYQLFFRTNKLLCVAFYVLYHYFQLTNFFWMFIEGLYLYLLVVKTFSGDNIKLKLCLFIGWGLPFVVTVIWGTAKATWGSLETPGTQEAALSQHCPWMVHRPIDWLYQAPALVVLSMNVIFLTRIMWVLITKLRSANNAETQQYRKAAKALLVLIPLLGVTYMLVVYGPPEEQVANAFSYARAVLLSSQGLLVVLFYCFLNSEVRNAVGHHYSRWRTARSLGTGQHYYAHWAPRSRTESIRLYSRPAGGSNGNACTSSAVEPALDEAPTTPTANNNHVLPTTDTVDESSRLTGANANGSVLDDAVQTLQRNRGPV
ncbi:diuretic hormone receptor [Copidosoma floridanum]|uniref:diuretic hormone receptor n=1 Tax=Copidosoma floridanum TaxID=29053 RepID=UPI000C6F6140|nr:diuretic hormone receptor [Copidosoma floridanum]